MINLLFMRVHAATTNQTTACFERILENFNGLVLMQRCFWVRVYQILPWGAYGSTWWLDLHLRHDICACSSYISPICLTKIKLRQRPTQVLCIFVVFLDLSVEERTLVYFMIHFVKSAIVLPCLFHPVYSDCWVAFLLFYKRASLTIMPAVGHLFQSTDTRGNIQCRGAHM